MHWSSMRSSRALVAALSLIVGVSLLFASGTFAFAAGPKASPEPGWPESHHPENDPKPGQPGYAPLTATTVEPPQGWTDAEFKARDPKGYAAMLPERQRIEAGLLAAARGASSTDAAAAKAGRTSASAKTGTVAALATTPVSPFGYLRFTLVRNTTSPYARNGYLGTLYFFYGIYQPLADAYRWFSVSWPARSGDNIPAHQSTVNLGPIPAYTWDFGFMNAVWRGYEPDARVEFAPGKWRLDPWTGGPYGRSCLEVHGGTGVHEFAPTAGCIRIYPSSLGTLKTYYDTKMANKKDRASAHLTVKY